MTPRSSSRLVRGLVLALTGVVLAALVGVSPASASLRFEDVSESDTFSADVDWLASRGVTRGCNPPENSRFCPDDRVTRGQMAAFLSRALGLPAADAEFADSSGHIFEADIAALAEAGITRGCNPPDNSRFCPDDYVTRGQMAAFLTRALGLTGGHFSFDDTAGHVFEQDVSALAEDGITRGCNPPDNTRFCPDDYVTRGQMAAFIHRALPDLPPVATPGANWVGPAYIGSQPSISGDGRFIAHEVEGAIRIEDRSTGRGTLISDLPFAGYSHPTISADGEWIAAEAYGSEDATVTLIVVNRRTGDHHEIAETDASSIGLTGPDISADGRFVVFEYTGDPLVPGASDPDPGHIHVWDRHTGEYQRITDRNGNEIDQGYTGEAFISADGNTVVFSSNTLTISDDTPPDFGIPPSYIYTWDRTSGTTELVSRDRHGNPASAIGYHSIDADGSVVSFVAELHDIYPDSPGEDGFQLFLRDIDTGQITVVPEWGSGGSAPNRSELSDDGRTVAYFARVGDSIDGTYQLFAWDADSNRTRLLSSARNGDPANRTVLVNSFSPGEPALAGDGTWAAFVTAATNLGGSSSHFDVYVAEASP